MDQRMIMIEKLNNGETVSLGAIEITSIPHISIIGDNQNNASEIITKYKNEMSSMLNEVFQVYKTESYRSGQYKDISLELLWTTEKVFNQPFNARIRLYVIVRAIDSAEAGAIESTETVLRIVKSTLNSQKYEYEGIDCSEFIRRIDVINNSSIKAIVKEERIENLQNQLLPYCYSYDRIPLSDQDMSRIVGALIDYPDCAVSMQLIPSILNAEETAEIDRIAQALDMLSKGVMDQSIGNVSFTLANRHAEVYRYYSEHKNAALFAFNVLILGSQTASSSISSRVLSHISTGSESDADLRIIDLGQQEADIRNNLFPLPWAVNEAIQYNDRNTNIWSTTTLSRALFRLRHIITAEEAAEFFRLPVGSDSVSAGLSVNESSKSSKTYSANIINAGDITIGRLRASSRGDTIGFSLKDLAKHMLVVGTPGSGKTTFSVGLLARLWKQHHIPFLVIEPAKNEYRALVQSIPDLQIFTLGKNFISPFVFNPFVPPKNVKLESYKSTLKTAFAAAVSMSTPLDKIFEESINNCYSDFRWLDTYTVDDKGKTFNISDFIKCFQETFDAIGYTGDAKNIGRAGVVRLNSMINLFDNYHSIPIEDILSKPTIIELAAIENSDQKALIISLLLLSILSYVNNNYLGEGGLKNVILLEEAHVLLDADTNVGQGEANPSAIAQGLVKRMLAEIRSYGVGIVIADQSPRKVTSDVVALTDIKVAFRLVEASDKQVLADSINMDEAQFSRLSKLKPGEAFFFFNKLENPEEVITPDYRLENNISITLSDNGIKELSTYWKDKRQKLRPYPECCMTPYCSETCDYHRRILAREIARRIFIRNFRAETKDFEVIRKVFSRISALVITELNDEPFDRQLLSCVKVQLWRKIKYGTRIQISDQLIENSLTKE